jgi:hypothetical protein
MNEKIKQLSAQKGTTEQSKHDLESLYKGKCSDYNLISQQNGQLETEVHSLKDVISKIKLDSTNMSGTSTQIRTQLDVTEKN